MCHVCASAWCAHISSPRHAHLPPLPPTRAPPSPPPRHRVTTRTDHRRHQRMRYALSAAATVVTPLRRAGHTTCVSRMAFFPPLATTAPHHGRMRRPARDRRCGRVVLSPTHCRRRVAPARITLIPAEGRGRRRRRCALASTHTRTPDAAPQRHARHTLWPPTASSSVPVVGDSDWRQSIAAPPQVRSDVCACAVRGACARCVCAVRVCGVCAVCVDDAVSDDA